MSLASDRAALAQAVGAVAGLTGYDDTPPMLNVGDAWVRWAGYEAFGPPSTFTSSWKIYVITGGTPDAAMKFLDTHLETLTYAVEPLVYVTSVAPIDFTVPNSAPLYGAEINCTKEN